MAGGASIFRLDLLGDKALEVKLNALPEKVTRRLLRSSLRAGAKLIAAEVKARVPTEIGATKRSLKVRAGRGGRGLVQYRIFIDDLRGLATLGARRTKRVGKLGAKREGYYPAAIELGYVRAFKGPPSWRSVYQERAGRQGEYETKSRLRKSRRRAPPQHVAPRPFMRGALSDRHRQALDIIAKDLWAGIKAEAAESAAAGVATS